MPSQKKCSWVLKILKGGVCHRFNMKTLLNTFFMFHSIKQQQLFYVLAAYSMYNTEVGYCQGMSQIAALLLMYMSEEVG